MEEKKTLMDMYEELNKENESLARMCIGALGGLKADELVDYYISHFPEEISLDQYLEYRKVKLLEEIARNMETE